MDTPTLPWDDPPDTVSAPGVRFVVSVSAADRLAVASDALGAAGVDDWLVLAPTRAQADDVVRRACGGRDAVVGRHRLGLTTLATRLALLPLAGMDATPLSGLGFEAVVARAVESMPAQDEDARLAEARRHPGFLAALASTLAELRLADVTPAQMRAAGGRAAQLAPYAEALEQALQALGQADHAHVLRLAIAALDAGAPLLPTLDDVSVLIVDPPCDTYLERTLVAAVVRRAGRAVVVGPAGDMGVRALASDLGVDPEVLPAYGEREGRTQVRRVQAYLFEPSADADVPPDADGSVVLLSAPGEGRECVEIARCLADAAADGLPFDEMAVIVRAPQLYASHLETALRRAEVPAWFARGTRRPDPAGRALLALIACALEQVSARRFAEYLSLGQVPTDGTTQEDGSDSATPRSRDLTPDASNRDLTPARRSPWRWEGIVNDAAVIAGRDRWHRRLAGYREDLRLRAAAVELDEPESPRLEGLRRQMALVDELAAFALPIVDMLAAWPDGTASWGTWLERLRALASTALARTDGVAEVLDELQPMAAIDGVSLREVFDVLRDRLTHATVPAPHARYGRVFVGTPEDVRGRTFSLVCVLGLSERVFPQRSRQDPLLLDADRRRLSSRLRLDDDRVALERLRLRLAVGAASARLVTSFASFDAAQSRPRVPSFYALDIYRACGGRLIGYEDVLREAQQASGARLAWPAHADARRAIDRTEHDLSVLQRYLRGDLDDVRGRARYLFEGHPALRRSLLMQHERTRRRWTGSDGLVAERHSEARLRVALAAHRLNARAYSVSAIQRYAVCPYQFYLSTIVRLAPREEATAVTSLDPLTRGSIVHEILATAMRTFEASGWLPMTADRVADAAREADAIVLSVTASHRDRLMPPVERIWLDEVQAIRRDVREWVRRLPDDQRGWTPRYVEFGFGFGRGDGRDEHSLASDVTLEGGWRLHGIIDLIERGPGDTWRITDYKTGRNRLPAETLVNKGETLQPVLYAMALERALGGRVTEARLWFCTADGGFTEHFVPVEATHDRSARALATTVLTAVDRAVETGFLPAAPRKDACKWCDFAPVCGPGSQTRTSRKLRQPLGDLLMVRELR